MSNSNENFSTPVQTRGSKRLGLRRSSSSVKKTQAPETAAKKTDNATGATCEAATTPRRQPQSDAKVKYHNREHSNKTNDGSFEAPSPGTPNAACSLQRLSVSTNCRPYRMSLSKRVREKMTKKRLEFHMANEMEKEDEERKQDRPQETKHNAADVCQFAVNKADSRPSTATEVEQITIPANKDKEPEQMSRDELLVVIEQCRKELKARQTHEAKVQELREAISTWQIGFSTALSELQKKLPTAIDTETLLTQLRLPKEMIKYVND